jgi:hypothetical protein
MSHIHVCQRAVYFPRLLQVSFTGTFARTWFPSGRAHARARARDKSRGMFKKCRTHQEAAFRSSSCGSRQDYYEFMNVLCVKTTENCCCQDCTVLAKGTDEVVFC